MSHSVSSTSKGTTLQAFFNFFKSLFGAGILSLPYAVYKVGIVTGMVIWVAVACLCYSTMMLVLQCRDECSRRSNRQVMTYGEVFQLVFGPKGVLAIEICIDLMQLMFCTGFTIVIVSQLNELVPSVSIVAFCFIVYPVLAVLSWIPFIKDLWVTSFFGLLVYMTGIIGLTVYQSINNFSYQPNYNHSNLSFFTHMYGTSIYAMEAVGLVIPITVSMTDPTKSPIMISSSLALYTLVSMGFASIAVMSGTISDDDACHMIIDCLSGNTILTIVRIALVTALILTHPLYLVVPACHVDELLFHDAVKLDDENIMNESLLDNHDEYSDLSILNVKHFSNSKKDNQSTSVNIRIKKIIIRSLLVLATCLVAATRVNFSLFIAVGGSTLVTAVGFLIPVMMYIEYFKATFSFRHWAYCVFVIVCGLTALVTGLIEIA